MLTERSFVKADKVEWNVVVQPLKRGNAYLAEKARLLDEKLESAVVSNQVPPLTLYTSL